MPPRIVAPPADALRPEPADIEAATAPIIDALAGRTTAVLTGAGISTDSGVPDYRSPGSPPRTPMTYQQFLSGPTFRRHYWARNHLGWRHLLEVAPNAGHMALAELESSGVVNGVITQNIDLLHVRAGSRNVVHLHGRYDRVVCLDCRLVIPREEHDAMLVALNPGWRERMASVVDVEVAPDADAVLASTGDFVVADCPRCGGVLSPDVVFFGATTPPERVTAARTMVEEADALLVVGSSLAVMSGLRFVRQAAKEDKPIVIVSRGPSRGDDLAAVKVEAGASRVLPLLARVLPGS
ncbi:Sir2 family NAD-dependent protein deacetylase [Georgenia sunbinii]|uniref:Sir2 family NAD-dependent protein deacetylase n=1 Tax=Georgenia sunbinii TaxID=3117728 RepID=UPI003D9C4A95